MIQGIINLCRHEIKLLRDDNSLIKILPPYTGNINFPERLPEETEVVDWVEFNGEKFPVVRIKYIVSEEALCMLKNLSKENYLIVPNAIKLALEGTEIYDKLVCPLTVRERGTDGNFVILGCKALRV